MVYFTSEMKTERLVSTHPNFPIPDHFPAREVEICIREALEAEQAAQTLLRPKLASACEPEVDSLVVIELICAIEELLGVTLPTSFAPRGGYGDVEACVSDLIAQTRGVWAETVKQTEDQHA